MGIKQLYNDNLQKLPNEYWDVSVMERNGSRAICQSKWPPKGVTLTLHGSSCVHTSMNLRKMKFIPDLHFIFILFLSIICEIFI